MVVVVAGVIITPIVLLLRRTGAIITATPAVLRGLGRWLAILWLATGPVIASLLLLLGLGG